MATVVPPKKNTAFSFDVALPSQAGAIFQVNPTLATGDVKVSLDGGSFNNITSLPTAISSGAWLTVALTSSEMNADRVVVAFHDAAGDQWCDVSCEIFTVARQIDDLAFPNTSGRGIDVTTGGGVGIDWANVENPTTAVNLSATNIDVDQAVASVSGAVGSVTGAVGSVAAGGIAAASFAANAINAAKLDPDVTTELQAGLATSASITTLQTSVDDLPTNAELATALGTADDAVLAQIALVKAKTDSLTFTVANQADVNVQSVNDVTVNGVGTAGSPWGP